MTLRRIQLCVMSLALGLATTYAVSPANAQQPYGANPYAYQAQAPGYGYQQGYPATNGRYAAPRVARLSTETIGAPAPVQMQAPMQMQAPGNYTNQYPSTAQPGGCSGCATGAAAGGNYASGAGCSSGACGGGNYGAGSYGAGGFGSFGSLFSRGGGAACGTGGGYGYGGGSCGVGNGGGGYGLGGGRFGANRGCRHWFGSVSALYMKRDHENEVWLSWNGADLASQVLGSHDGDPGWATGNEIRFGSTFINRNSAWEVVFWGLYGEDGSTTVFASDLTGVGAALNSSLDFSGLDYNDGSGVQGVNSFYDDAVIHRAAKHQETQNIELNFIKFPLATCMGPCGVSPAGYGGGGRRLGAGGGAGYGAYNYGGMYGAGGGAGACGPRFSVVATAGLRYMRIQEWFDFDTDNADNAFGDSASELYLDIETKNHLLGFQLGCAANYQATDRLSLYCDGKFGIYNNHVQHSSVLFGGNGTFAQVAAGLPFAGQNYDINSTADEISFLGELRLGGSYVLKQNCNGDAAWRVFGGYRAIAVTGVALPTNQIPVNFADVVGVANTKTNGSMVLHGFQGGIEWNY